MPRTVAAAAVLAVAAGLPAQGLADVMPQGPYLSLGGGPNWTRDSTIDLTGASNVTADFDAGLAAVFAGGYALGNGFRGELELGYRTNDVGSLTNAASASGDVETWSLMANALYDIDTGTAFTPYLGVGLGAAIVDFGGVSPVSNSRFSRSQTRFAYQGIVGVGYAIDERASLFADYRYFATTDVKGRLDNGTAAKADYANHTLLVGLRYSFARPAPRPVEAAPAPAPAPVAEVTPAPEPEPVVIPRPVLVFFDFDSSALTPEARATIHETVDLMEQAGYARIELTGHTDRAGPAAYNMRLSQRRADSVRAELIRLGVPPDQIVTFARGEEEPLVPTADGVREPQNRRVEIVVD